MTTDIAIISGSMSTSQALKKQLLEYSDQFEQVKLYGIDDYFPQEITCDLMIYSSDIAFKEIRNLPNEIISKDYILATRTIDFDKVDDLFKIRKGEKVYIINDDEETTAKFIHHLKTIGLEDIVMVPLFPGMTLDPKIRYAITPGDILPAAFHIEQVIDIGPRLFGLETIHEILKAVGLIDSLKGTYSESYLSKVVKITKNSARFASDLEILNEQLNMIMSKIDEGIMVVDQKNKIQLMNKPLTEFLNIPYRNYKEETINRVIKDQRIVDFCIGIKTTDESFFTVNRVNLVFARQKLSSGITIIFVKNLEERILESNRLNQELVKKGHVAKYNFDHILGQSKAINEAKYIAQKLATSELTILIEGESGTGKELFASAIHNLSNRKDKAYLAINFSAFTDELIESELFGYEDGAFTGAKKGGKVGLFELANGGTLMLDEIGDISPKMQTRLLRVLQEREIIRIGGTIIHSVDVRIIAATNKNLRKMVDEGTFREDLYYRLKMGTLQLPPLRSRQSDIPMLLEHFLEGQYTITEEAQSLLTNYPWKGNVRELKGTIEYMKAIAEYHQITLRDVPQEIQQANLFNPGINNSLPTSNALMANRVPTPITNSGLELPLPQEELVILQTIMHYNIEGIPCGRQRIQKHTYDTLGLSENQIRHRMNKLVDKGLIENQIGRSGSLVTPQGMQRLQAES
jgi:transcriptional regulator with PAS, ATPase and Fis domain